jgi:hypothetical protein
MKFTVRAGFMVHHDTLEEVEESGRKIKQPRRESYYGGQTVKFNAEQAAAHIHKLEPADREAAAFLSQFHKSFKPSADAPGA